MARARGILLFLCLWGLFSAAVGTELPVGLDLIARTGAIFSEGSLPFGQVLTADGKPVLKQNTEEGPEGQPPVLSMTDEPDISNNPDFQSILKGPDGKLYLVSQFESPNPAAAYVTELQQDADTGKLTPVSSQPVDFSAAGGLWTPCAGIVTPWGTHLGGEEYEPDARIFETATSVLGNESTSLFMLDPEASFVNAIEFARYFGKYAAADGLTMEDVRAAFNPYLYGHAFEIKVGEGGKPEATKWFTMGRNSKELAYVMPDNKTVYITDDGTQVGFFKFVADTAGDLSSGTLYAAAFTQTSDADGGAFDITWIPLGSAINDELKSKAKELQFSDIFEYAAPAEDGSCPEGFTSINAGDRLQECLKLKEGAEKWAGFFETRRYAAMLGATTEFSKWEGLTFSPLRNKIYTAMTEIRYGMEDNKKKGENDTTYDIGAANSVRLEYNPCGCVYELDVDESYNVATMSALVCGTTEGGDDDNKCSVEGISSPDNLSIMDDNNILLIGEDTSAHQNDVVWAYNLETGNLTRIASTPYGAESTSVYFYPDINGFAYIMAAVQHPYGESDEDEVGNPFSEGLEGYVGYMVMRAADIAGRALQFVELPVALTEEAKSKFAGTTGVIVS